MKVSKEQLLEFFKTRYSCVRPVTITTNAGIKGSKSIRKLLLNEVLEALEEPIKALKATFLYMIFGEDEGSQLMRVKVKSEKDGLEGYVTIQAVSGALGK